MEVAICDQVHRTKILCLNYSRMDTCPFVAGEDAAVMALGDVP